MENLRIGVPWGWQWYSLATEGLPHICRQPIWYFKGELPLHVVTIMLLDHLPYRIFSCITELEKFSFYNWLVVTSFVKIGVLYMYCRHARCCQNHRNHLLICLKLTVVCQQINYYRF